MHTNSAYREPPKEEIVGGRVVLMAPPMTRHTRTERNLSRIFDTFLSGQSGEYFPETGLFLRENEEEYIPDGMVVCDPEKVREDGVHGAPELVIEVLSPSTARYDKGHKKDAYEAAGVLEYWLVDPANKLIDQYLLREGGFFLNNTYALLPEFLLKRMSPEERAGVCTEIPCGLYSDLTIRLEDIFARVP